MATWYRLSGSVPDDALFPAVQAYYVLLIKLLVGHFLAESRGEASPADALAHAASPATCRRALEQLDASAPIAAVAVGVAGARLDWLAACATDEVACAVAATAARVLPYRLGPPLPGDQGSQDLFKALYERLIPRAVRHRIGEYYTPQWLAAMVLDKVLDGAPRSFRLLDPACGSGTFLLEAIRRLRAAPGRDHPGGVKAEDILGRVGGFDLNPLAVMAARANCLIALRDLLPRSGPIDVPVRLRDAILDPPAPRETGTFDCVVGNPPWIAWDHLPPAYREATKPLWQRYGLFSLGASEARHGGGKKDLAMLFVYACADRYLAHGGRLGMVVPQTLFQTARAGDGFRRFRLGADGPPLCVLAADDLVDVRPFDAGNWTATLVLQKGRPTEYPVPYFRWGRCAASGTAPRGEPSLADFTVCRLEARPVDPKRPGSPWAVSPPGLNASGLGGPAEYEAHLGANTGGANGVYWLRLLEGRRTDPAVLVENLAEVVRRGAPRRVEAVQTRIEADLLFPLLRWGEVARWRAVPRDWILLAQDPATRRGIPEETLAARYPLARAYLGRFEPLLRRRAAYRRYQSLGPFWAMYDVGPYTVAPWKVVWRRMDRQVRAAVVGTADGPLGPRPVTPQETCVLIAAADADEAHYLCAVLNSAVVDDLVRSCQVRGGKGFGTPSMLRHVPLRRFDHSNPVHRKLAAASRQAHQAAAAGQPTDAIESTVNALTAELWGLAPR